VSALSKTNEDQTRCSIVGLKQLGWHRLHAADGRAVAQLAPTGLASWLDFALMRHFLRILSLLLPLTAAAQSALPPCPTDVSVRWHQCFGTFSDKGEKYVGEFRNDRYHGQGTYYFPSGATYAGEFRDGVRHGRGAYTFANGVRFVGE
jgi:hypothetical protein